MASGYTRQSTAQIVNGLIINDTDFNNEYNALLAAFNGSTGHDHSGGTGLGPPISLTLTNTGVTGVLDAKFGGIHTAAADPAATDDTPDFVVGSWWINTTSKEIFECVDNTSTAAVWRKVSGTTSASLPTTTSDVVHGYTRGSVWIYTGVSPNLLLVCVDATASAAVWYPIRVGRFGVITGSTTIPTTANDATQGYAQGSLIYNSTSGAFFICTSPTASAATWSALLKSYAASGAPGTAQDNTQGYQVGSPGVDTSTGVGYICTSAATSAATWALITFDEGQASLIAGVYGV